MKDTVSLEIAQRLQKAGWKGQTEEAYIKSWYDPKPPFRETNYRWDLKDCIRSEQERLRLLGKDIVPAPTATQLAEEMPGRNKRWKREDTFSNDWWCRIDFGWSASRNTDGSMKNSFHINFIGDSGQKLLDEDIVSDSLPDALGLMLCYLYENGLLTDK